MQVLGISGSLRKNSNNTRLLTELLETQSTAWQLADLSSLPLFNEDLEQDVPDSVIKLRQQIQDADAVIFMTPEYNGAMSGVLKNALDWISRPSGQSVIYKKPSLALGSSSGLFGAVWAQADLRKVLEHIGAEVINLEEIPLARAHQIEHLEQDYIGQVGNLLKISQQSIFTQALT